jgi:Undecaprenyl-phosphate galactose phosphotransferase WbaP
MSPAPLQFPSSRVLTAGSTVVSREIPFPRLLDEHSRHVKRWLDLACGMLLGVAALPLIALIALAVSLDSRGAVFYSQERLGAGRRRFRVWKFRSMFVNAEEVLQAHLAADEDAAAEWEATHKLKQDPRVTRVGRWLRRTSLDELPQLWNILRGDMSIVGPRPIVDAEVPKYGAAFVLYSQVKPGLTGLWQVSGRNDTSYRRRVELDAHYIRTWTFMTDLAILAKTFRAVLTGRGAY